MDRPALRRLLGDLQPGDIVVVYRLDRLTRSVSIHGDPAVALLKQHPRLFEALELVGEGGGPGPQRRRHGLQLVLHGAGGPSPLLAPASQEQVPILRDEGFPQ